MIQVNVPNLAKMVDVDIFLKRKFRSVLPLPHYFNGKNPRFHMHFVKKSTSVTPTFLHLFALNANSCISVKNFRSLVDLLEILLLSVK